MTLEGENRAPPSLSIVVCSHNGADKLPLALGSLAAQTLAKERYEVIVVDDGSVDTTSIVAAQYDVRLIRLDTNSGLAGARNAGVSAARAAVVAFTDDDCEVAPDWAAQMLAAFADAEIDAAGGLVVPEAHGRFMRGFLQAHNPLRPLGVELLRSSGPGHRLKRYLSTLTSGNSEPPSELYSVVGANMAFRRDAIVEAGGFDEAFRFGGEEEDLCRRLHARPGGARIAYVRQATVVHWFEDSIRDTLRRSRSYGRGNARAALKHPEVRPIVYPFPLVLAAALALTAHRRARSVGVVLASPWLLYPGWMGRGLSTRSAVPAAYPMVQLAQELSTMWGEVEGFREGYEPVPADNLRPPSPGEAEDYERKEGNGKADLAERVGSGPGGEMSQLPGERLRQHESDGGDVDPGGESIDRDGEGDHVDDSSNGWSALHAQHSPEGRSASGESSPHVSFVVLNWRNPDATRKCVDSILALRRSVPIEIIVVDNESTAASRRELADGPWRLVPLPSNLGFTGGMNAGAAAASGEFIALLNNDLTLDSSWLEHALEAANDPAVAIVGGRDDDGTVPIVYPAGSLYLSNVESRQRRVPTVDGAHMFVRRTVWEEVGGFDDDFFAYFEETDLCARVLALGYQVVYDPAMRARHSRGLASDRVPWRRVFWARRNRLIWLAKHFPKELWVGVIMRVVGEYCREAVLGARGKRAGSRADLEARTGSLAAVMWFGLNLRWLRGKRRAVIAAGQHDERYRDFVVSSLAALKAEHPEIT